MAWPAGTFELYTVSSRSVLALTEPPTPSTFWESSPASG
jgi:hypothetical protein